MSFGHSELMFADDGFIRVTGINENPSDLAVSNGSGKSSLWEAIVWALTGDTIRGTKQISNLYGDDGTYVKLEFSVDSKFYEILRSKDHKEYKTNLRIVIDGKDCSGKGIRDSDKLLVQYLPDLTASLLGSVIILGQGLPQKFTNNTPSGRKEVLENLSKSDFMIEDLKSRVSNRKNDLNTQLRTTQDTIVSLTSTKNYLEEKIKVAMSDLDSLDASLIENQLDLAKKELEKCHVDLNGITHDIDYYSTQIEQMNQQLLKLTTEFNEQQECIRNEYKDDILFYQVEGTRITSEISSIRKEIKQIENIKDVCPTCGQKLPDVHKPDTSSLVASIDSLNQQLQEMQKKLTDSQTTEQQRLQVLKQSHEIKLSELTSSIRVMNDKLTMHRAELQEQLGIERSLQNSINDFSTKLAQLEATIQHHRNTINESSISLEDIHSKLLYNNNEKDLQQSRLDVISKFDTALKRDFRGYLLSTVIDYIQIRAKEYSKLIFETDCIDFNLDGNNINIAYMNKAYENLSGGEKQKIDLIVQFSIRDMLCNHLGFTSNILVLDEVFDGLDMIGCQRVLDVISGLTDIKNIFIVTHRKDLSIPTDREIVVVKSSSGISEIR